MKHIIYTIKHKFELFRLWCRTDYMRKNVSIFRVIMHDMEKLILQCICGDKIATKIHRIYAGHHNITNHVTLCEAILDWECARFSKPDKPLNAVQTATKYYPEHLDKTKMIAILCKW